MTNTTIDISLTLDGSTAGRIISCLKEHEPEVWEVLKKELKKQAENDLANKATFSINDKEANEAMKTLREKYDSTYFWCEDCDGLAVKESECCLNKIIDNNEVVSF